ncbi:MAG: hypothetical protein IKB64_10560 [Paludibacteraceae bacterium]|nr:hypothetical protein [Paludibacteraceae bacterium]
MKVSMKFMSFSSYVDNFDDIVTNAVNDFLKEENITPDMLMDVRLSSINNSNWLGVMIVYKEY